MSRPLLTCPSSVDDSFGPWAGPQCRGGFDFTLLFEESILALPIICIFIIVLPGRILQLAKSPVKVVSNPLRLIKLIACLCLASLNLALLVLWATTSSLNITHTRAPVTTAALTFIASVSLCLGSWLEHWRSIRPSFILNVYLFLSVLLNLPRVRTLWMLGPYEPIPIVFTAAMVLQTVMIILESTEKRRILVPQYKSYAKESTSGTFNRGIFFWLTSLFLDGYKNLLTLDDLYPLDHKLKSHSLQDKFQTAWDGVSDKERSGALLNTWLSVQWPWYMAAVFPRLCQSAFRYTQPFLITQTIELAYSPDTVAFNNRGYGLIGAYVLVYSGLAISIGQCQWRTYRTAVAMRGALVPCVMRKTLRLESTQVNPSAALTLITTDIETITQGVVQMHEVWASVLEISIGGWLLYRQIGAAVGVAIGFAIAVVFGTFSLAIPTGLRQADWIQASQTRVAATSRILGNVKSLRLSGLNDIAFATIESLRQRELRVSRTFRLFLGATIMLSISAPSLTPVLSFAAFTGLNSAENNGLTISKAFTSLSLFVLLNGPLISLIVTLPSIAGAVASFARIQAYLNGSERVDQRKTPGKNGEYVQEDGSSSPQDAPFPEKESRSANEPIPKTGSGPTDPDKNIMVAIEGKFSWPETTESVINIERLNIRRGTFTMILGPVGCGKSTLLKAMLGELSKFEGHIRTSCSEIGYCEQTPWLPNGTIREAIIGNCTFDQALYNKVLQVCALEQDLRRLSKGDQSRIGSKGMSLSGGQKQRLAISRAVYSRRELCVFDDVFSGLDPATENKIFFALFGDEGLFRTWRTTTIVASSDSRRATYADFVIILDASGKIVQTGTAEAIAAHPGNLLDIIKKPQDGKAQPKTDVEDLYAHQGKDESLPSTTIDPGSDLEADLTRQTGDSTVYKFYARSAGWKESLGFLIGMAAWAFCDAFPSIWLKWWAASESPTSNLGKWLGVYAALGIGAIVSCLLSAWELFIVIITRSGRHFHSMLIKTVSKAPMSLFTNVDHGITVNRFSQDLQLIDMELPAAAIGVAVTLAVAVAQCAVMAVASRYIAISFPVILVVFYLIQRFYLRTSRQMRLIDIEAKAPLYSQLMETLNGLASIRAFGWESRIMETNFSLLDDSQRPNYLLYCLQRWLIFSVDMVIAFLALMMIIITTTLRKQIGPGYMGVALTNVIGFGTTLQGCILSWVALETSIGAVARIKKFVAAVESEEDEKQTTEHLPEDWPSRGAVEFRNLCASYPSSGLVLKGITISVSPGQKVGVCGRTGSGKSSLALALFRMLDFNQGSILVDDQDISQLPHDYIRTALAAIPQDVCILDGSVRLNVDPSGSASDDMIISALEKVQLWETTQRRGGLDAKIDDKFFSQGQLQLLVFARAMLRKSKILVLDEATSSLDHQTRTIVDEVLRSWFADWTIVAIVHKLESIRDFDKIAVLDEGRLIEFDEPEVLLARQDSAFRRLYRIQRNEDDGEELDSRIQG